MTRCLLLSILFILLFAGCGKRTTPVEHATREGILLFGVGADPSELDPHLTTGLNEFKIHLALFEGLVTPHPDTLEPLPGVAKSWEVSSDGLTYTFHLREDARWSNGDPVTAQDFAFSWKRILSPSLGADYAKMLFPISGAEAYNKGMGKWKDVRIEILNTHTLRVTLENPTPYFLSLLSHNAYMPVHRQTLAAHGPLFERGNRWTRPANHVSNGPFHLHEWNLTQHVEVRKNPHYWDRENVALNGIRFYGIPNQNTEERAFRAGQLHVTESVPFNKIDVYRQEFPDRLQMNPWLGVYYYIFNTNLPPLDDPRVRKALAMAIDRRSIVENITLGGQAPAYNFTPNIAGYTPDALLQESVEAAQNLLTEAGYPGGQGFPELEVLYNTSEFHRPIAEAIQHMWKTHLGIDVSLRNTSWKTYLAQRKEKDFQIARAGWIGDYVDPNTFLSVLRSDSGNNHTGWGSERYDALLRQASMTANPEKRLNILRTAEAIVIDAMPVLPIYFYTRVYLIRPEVQGWQTNILDIPNYKSVSLKLSETSD